MDTKEQIVPPQKPKDMREWAKRAWGKEWNDKEVAYEFSNKRKFYDGTAFYQST